MIQPGRAVDYWNSRADKWHTYAAPLIPGQEELSFHRKQLLRDGGGGDTLILGVTPQLCALALETSVTVTSVDYAAQLIKALGIQGVRYECEDWLEFFTQTDKRFKTIMTDGGPLG